MAKSKAPLVIGIVIVVILIMAIIAFMMMGSSSSAPASSVPTPTPSGAPAPSPAPTPAPAPSAFSCGQSQMSAAKTYYDTQGEWKGVFTMNPQRIADPKTGQKQCDVNYLYQPIPGNPQGRHDTGVDFRRFTYDDGGRAINMGGYNSGTSAR